MLNRKCTGCAEKVERKHNYCPWCGHSMKAHSEEKDFGLLGRSDNNQSPQPAQPQLPFGLNKMVNSLMKQIEKELSGPNAQGVQGMPKGFNIKIQTGMPQNMQSQSQNQQKPQPKMETFQITQEEADRRYALPKEEAQSKVKRIADKIIYEIQTPGIKFKKDVAINKLEEGFEVKAYAKDKCYM
ncbi:MAG: hypothetical protein ACI83O_000807, partial [Patescibacteria group bacterium]